MDVEVVQPPQRRRVNERQRLRNRRQQRRNQRLQLRQQREENMRPLQQEQLGNNPPEPQPLPMMWRLYLEQLACMLVLQCAIMACAMYVIHDSTSKQFARAVAIGLFAEEGWFTISAACLAASYRRQCLHCLYGEHWVQMFVFLQTRSSFRLAMFVAWLHSWFNGTSMASLQVFAQGCFIGHMVGSCIANGVYFRKLGLGAFYSVDYYVRIRIEAQQVMHMFGLVLTIFPTSYWGMETAVALHALLDYCIVFNLTYQHRDVDLHVNFAKHVALDIILMQKLCHTCQAVVNKMRIVRAQWLRRRHIIRQAIREAFQFAANIRTTAGPCCVCMDASQHLFVCAQCGLHVDAPASVVCLPCREQWLQINNSCPVCRTANWPVVAAN
jgi:hypothetical protein